jgi:D-alanine-D-alanine ligase
MAAHRLTIAILANLKKNAPHLPGEAPDAHDDLDSERTINALKASLEAGGHKAVFVEGNLDIVKPLQKLKPDLVFNICEMHWGDSREAQIPALLELLRIPYTASGVLTMALTQDKPMTKRVLAFHGLPTPEFQEFTRADEPLDPKLKFPLFVKPAREGTGMGVDTKAVVHNEAELRERVAWVIARYHEPALVERFIEGREVTLGLLGNPPPEHSWRTFNGVKGNALYGGTFDEAIRGGAFHFFPPEEIDFNAYPVETGGIYTNQLKVELGDAFHVKCPAPLTPKQIRELQRLTAATFQVTGCHDVARVDFRLDKHDNDKPYILEINPLPGMSPGYSDLCIAAEVEGIDHVRLVNGIVRLACRRYGIPYPEPVPALVRERAPRRTPRIVLPEPLPVPAPA